MFGAAAGTVLSGNVPGTIRSYGGVVGRTQLAGMPTAPARRFRLTSPAACAVIGVVVLVLFIAAVPLAGLAHQNLNASSGSLPVWVTAPFAVVGWVLAWRRPANPVGWIMLAGAFFFALSEDASYYTVADYGLRHGDLPLGGFALFAQPGWAPGIVLVGLLILVFPDGRLPSSRWRWLMWPTPRWPRCGLLAPW